VSGARIWYLFYPDEESVDQCHNRRLRECPSLSPTQVECLMQLRNATWDGNLISKNARGELVAKGLVTRFNGWQIVTQEGLAVLDTLGMLRP
jgi:hypothetical protein